MPPVELPFITVAPTQRLPIAQKPPSQPLPLRAPHSSQVEGGVAPGGLLQPSPLWHGVFESQQASPLPPQGEHMPGFVRVRPAHSRPAMQVPPPPPPQQGWLAPPHALHLPPIPCIWPM